MENRMKATSKPSQKSQALEFNYDKLQAAACMAASAVVSIALLSWAIKSFF
jgi:hypothetical protein